MNRSVHPAVLTVATLTDSWIAPAELGDVLSRAGSRATPFEPDKPRRPATVLCRLVPAQNQRLQTGLLRIQRYTEMIGCRGD